MTDKKNSALKDSILSAVSVGTLPKGWEKLADTMYPKLKKQYGDVSYEEALDILAGYISKDDPDYQLIAEYMKKYFPDQQA